MMAHNVRGTAIVLVLGVGMLGCSLPWLSVGPYASATRTVATIFVLQTQISGAPIASATAAPIETAPPTETAAPTVDVTGPPIPTATPGKPVVTTTALCWTGPGPAYPVVSGVKAGTPVTILGVGSIAGWFVIENPTYRDRCWIQAANLALDPFFNTTGLQVFNPPPTPGPTVTPGPTPTP